MPEFELTCPKCGATLKRKIDEGRHGEFEFPCPTPACGNRLKLVTGPPGKYTARSSGKFTVRGSGADDEEDD